MFTLVIHILFAPVSRLAMKVSHEKYQYGTFVQKKKQKTERSFSINVTTIDNLKHITEVWDVYVSLLKQVPSLYGQVASQVTNTPSV